MLKFPPLSVAILALGYALSQPASAGETLQPYTAHYALDWASGVSFSGDAVRTLQQDGKQWQLKTEASALFASLSESSRFTLNPAITPQQYRFQRKVFGKKRRAELNFDWQKNQVTNNVNDQPWQMAIYPGVLDKLSVQLQLRLDLKAGKTQFNYKVADGGKLKDYHFVVDGKETVATPAGTFDTVRVLRQRGNGSSRKTWIWFAPELDHMIVKIRQLEKENKEYRLVLKQLER
ncbi:MAG: DUF3108 domain-containing protein [Marinobacterium sp.]|nr:DUF3108 domain-containing protein [Marinobacterium sp.]